MCHELLEIFSNLIGRVLDVYVLVLHQDCNNVVARDSSGVLHIVRVHVLFVTTLATCKNKKCEGAYIGPAHHIGRCPVDLLEHRVSEDKVWEVDSQNIFK